MKLEQTENHKGDILAVDDTPENLRLLTNLLREHDYKVRPVPNGTMALSVIEMSAPDLILLDIMMPSLNGYEVCSKLKDNPKYAHIPVIFISAIDDMIDKIKAFEVGGVDYITKPIQKEELLARVKVHLQLRALTQTLEDKNHRLQAEVQQRVTTEKALQQLNQKLETLVDQRAAQLRQSNEQLKISLHEKETLLKEVHHRVKNNLNVIISLLSLQSKVFNDPKVIQVFENNFSPLNVFSEIADISNSIERDAKEVGFEIIKKIKEIGINNEPCHQDLYSGNFVGPNIPN